MSKNSMKFHTGEKFYLPHSVILILAKFLEIKVESRNSHVVLKRQTELQHYLLTIDTSAPTCVYMYTNTHTYIHEYGHPYGTYAQSCTVSRMHVNKHNMHVHTPMYI